MIIGEDPADPVFYFSDLLTHLSARQNQRSLAEGIKGEELNILIGSIPYPEKGLKDPVKLKVLQILNEKYGIVEADFYRAELEVVAAGPARDVGFDRSLIASAAQDDRVCANPALRAELDSLHPTYTTVTILTDKEEIGSVGNTGLHSDYVRHYLEYLADPVPEKMPVLEDLYDLLRKQDEPEAQRLAPALDIYVTGSLNVFHRRP